MKFTTTTFWPFALCNFFTTLLSFAVSMEDMKFSANCTDEVAQLSDCLSANGYNEMMIESCVTSHKTSLLMVPTEIPVCQSYDTASDDYEFAFCDAFYNIEQGCIADGNCQDDYEPYHFCTPEMVTGTDDGYCKVTSCEGYHDNVDHGHGPHGSAAASTGGVTVITVAAAAVAFTDVGAYLFLI